MLQITSIQRQKLRTLMASLKTQKMAALLLLATSCLAQSGLEEAPLTPQDILLVSNSTAASLPSYTDNSTCVLIPASGQVDTCTWRSYRRCVRQPRVVGEAKYSERCHEEGAQHLTNCQVETVEQPLVHSVQECRIVADKQCMGPCFNCPTFCQPTEIGICEDSHSIRTEVSVEEAAGGTRVRIERDTVTSKRNCHTEQVEELCGNVNCKFVNPREECSQRNSSTLALLTERKCEICEPETASRVILEENCGEKTTRDCATDPLTRPWRKLCSAPSSPPGNAVAFSEEEQRGVQGRVGRVSLQDLLSSSVTSPVDDLVVQELSKIYKDDLAATVGRPVVVIPNSGRKSKEVQLVEEQLKVASEEEQLLEEELKLVRRLNNQAGGSTKIDMNVKVRNDFSTYGVGRICLSVITSKQSYCDPINF